jgi:uncharacterized protein YcbK (DUF882 family)
MNRRKFLTMMATTPLLFGNNIWGEERHLWLIRRETKEEFKQIFFRDGDILKNSFNDFCILMRDVRASEAVEMDQNLMHLLYAIQRRMTGLGIITPIYVNSGFRTQKTNSKLEGSVKNSFHIKGKAVDFSVDTSNFDTVFMGMIASEFRAGGVGFYPHKDFIHMDTGSIRSWVR